MKAEAFVVPVYQEPVGYLYDRCAFCAVIFDSQPVVDGGSGTVDEHVAQHAKDGDLEAYGVGDGGIEYRPVMGKPAVYIDEYVEMVHDLMDVVGSMTEKIAETQKPKEVES